MFTNHIILKIIIGIIIILFVLTGISEYLVNISSDYVAKVNGQKISYVQLEQAMQNAHIHNEYVDKQFSQLASNEGYIFQQVLSRLIDKTILDQYADKLGLIISDEQIRQTIFTIPMFYTDNKFDNAKFHFLLNNMGLTSDQYATMIRNILLTQQLFQGISGTHFLLPIETDRLLKTIQQVREARLATFDVVALSLKQTASDDEIQISYNMHKDQYVSPESFKVSYISIDAEAIQKKTTIDDKEIQSWYDVHHDQFIVPTRKHYSIIQSKIEDDANSLLQQLQHGADFSELAKVKSTDIISAKNGGDIGWMSENDTIDDLKQVDLNAKGQLSDVIKSSAGDYLIVRLNDIQPEKITPLSAVQSYVAIKAKQEKAIDNYYMLQQKINELASKKNETLASVGDAVGIKVQHTDWFNIDNVPTELNYNVVKQLLFNGSLLDNNSNVITIDKNHALIVRITNHKPKSLKPLMIVYRQVEQKVKYQKALEYAQIKAKKVLSALKNENDNDALKNIELNFGVPKNFSFTKNDLLAQAVFKLPIPRQGKASYDMVVNEQGNIIFIALDKVTPAQINDDQQKLFINQLNNDMINMIFDALLVNLRDVTKIKISKHWNNDLAVLLSKE